MADSISAEDRDEMAIPSYIHRNPAMRWMAWQRLDVVAKLLHDFSGDINGNSAITVMDFGCGTGVLFDEASKIADQVFGIDIVLEPARLLVDEWGLDKVSLLDPEDAKERVAAKSVNTIIAAEVLEHIEPLDDTLSFFRERLKPDGLLLVSLPTENMLYRLGRWLARFEGHYHQSNAAAIHQQILDAGFHQLRMIKIPAAGPLAIYWAVAYRLTFAGKELEKFE